MTEFQPISQQEQMRIMTEARLAQAEAFVDGVAAVFNAIGRLVRPVSRVVAGLGSMIAHRYAINQTYAELANLSDRELDDIGISRHDIRAVAEGIFSRPDVQTAELVVLAQPAKADDATAAGIEADDTLDRAA